MRIAIDVRSLMGGRHSGVEEYTLQIIKAMIRVAPEHEYHLFYNSWREAEVSEIVGVEMHEFRYPNKLFNLVQFIFNWPKWDKWVEADVFFVPNGRLLPLSSNVPYVVTVHDLSYELFPEFYSWWKRIWHKMVKSKYLVQNADHVIVVSQATADDVRRLYDVKVDKISVVYSGVMQEAENRVEKRAISPEDLLAAKVFEKFVLFLGTLEPRKNVVGLIEAWSLIADQVPHDLVIAGTKGWLEAEVERAIKLSKYKQRIFRMGFVEEGMKRELYRRADLFVYPSFYEGFGFPPLEALLAGTPVIISNNSALPEVVGEWATMINPYDVSELALVMEEILKNPPRISEETKREIERRFSWDEAGRKTLAVLEKVD